MLRLSVILLLLVNGLYFVWSEGLLRGFGFGPAHQREPQRIAQQIHPESVKVLSAAEIKGADAQAKADLEPKECFQAGPLDDVQEAALRVVLEADWPAQSWQLDVVPVSANWIVYMGKFANDEALAKKRGELAAMNLSPRTLTQPTLELSLSLGSFDTEEDAKFELLRLSGRGIRTAKVVLERPEGHASMLRLPAISQAMKPKLAELKAALADTALAACL